MKDILKELEDFKEKHYLETVELLKTITKIPAPSGKEEKRAEYIKKYLQDLGVDSEIDEVNNVIVEFNLKKDEKVNICMAHIDTVFEHTIIDLEETEDRIIAPGVGDDTANVAILLMVIKFVIENKISLTNTVFVFDSCEEGLGNLKGSRAIMNRYKDKMEKVLAFDLQYTQIINKAVGSRRFRVNVKTEGGHSYLAFGNKNSIEVLAKIIEEIYKIDTSKFESKTTYNVGKISGGTSVNTIAEHAEMLYEFRSEKDEDLDKMEELFFQVIEKVKTQNKNIDITKIGDRPATGKLDPKAMEELTSMCKEIIIKHTANDPKIISASTDANLPLSMGIPAVCIGTYDGCGEHTNKEFVIKESLKKGFMIAGEVVLKINNI